MPPTADTLPNVSVEYDVAVPMRDGVTVCKR